MSMNQLVQRMAAVGIRKAPLRSGALSAPITSRWGASSMSLTPPISSATRPLWLSNLPGQSTSFSTDSSPSKPDTATIFTDEATGEKYGMIIDTRNLPKLKPGIVKKRLAKCKTYEGRERGIRQSPWKLNRICQLAAGLTLEEALTQLQFCDLKNADLVAKVLKRTSNLADIRHGIQISQLEVAECFTTKSMMLKRMKPMGRGRAGIMHHRFSHIRVVLREIDFPLRIYQQKTLNQKKKWLHHQQRAQRDAQEAKAKRDEMERLERQQEEQLQERRAAANN